MALRTLAARIRSSALRVPPPAPSAQGGGQQGKRLDLNKASKDELLREVESMDKQIDEAWEAVRKDKEKVPGLMKDMFGTVKMWFGAGILVKVMEFSAPMLRPAAEAQPEQ